MGAKEIRGRRAGWLVLLGDWLVLLLLLAGGLDAFLSANAYVYDRWQLLALCALLSAASAMLYVWRRGGWAALGLLAVLALAARPLWERLLEPALNAFQHAGVRHAGLPLLCLLAGGLALLLGWLVVRARCWYLCAMVVTLPVAPAIMEGVLPPWGALLASTAGWGTLLLTALFDRHDKARLWRAQLGSLAGMGAFLALLTLLLPREGYLRPQWATDARDRLVSAAAGGINSALDWDIEAGDLILDIGGGNGSRPENLSTAGGMPGEVASGRVDLLSAGPRSYAGRPVMTVRTDQPDPAGTIFLLGGSSAAYTGESWEEAERYPGYTPPEDPTAYYQDRTPLYPDVFAARSAVDTPASTMTVSLLTGGGTLFTPYRLEEEPPDRVGKQYAVSYRPGGPEDGFAPLGGLLAEAEADYRLYVYRNYLEVPSETQMTLWPLLEGIRRQEIALDETVPEAYREALSAARQTARYLAGRAAYDLSVPAMERGGDFVEHFLELGRGYCVHFATAGTLLLRMQGVPARYASGYLAHLDGEGRASVLDSNAHAWVEIYLDGYGWYPVEMTPGASDSPSADPEEPAAPAESEPPAASPPQEPERTPEEESPSEQPPVSLGNGEEPGPPRESVDLTWLWRTLAALAAVLALAGLYRLALERRRRVREDADTNRSVIAAYGRYRRLTAWGCGEDGLVEELARKAKFSQHTLTEEERRAVWARLEELTGETAAALPGWKRRILRLLRPML